MNSETPKKANVKYSVSHNKIPQSIDNPPLKPYFMEFLAVNVTRGPGVRFQKNKNITKSKYVVILTNYSIIIIIESAIIARPANLSNHFMCGITIFLDMVFPKINAIKKVTYVVVIGINTE